MATPILNLEYFTLSIHTLLIIVTLIFTLTNFNIKNYIIFIVIFNLLQYLSFKYVRQENSNPISIGIPIGKVVYSKTWEVIAINLSTRSVNNVLLFNQHLFNINLRYFIEMNFELHTKNLCNSNEHLNWVVNSKPVIGIRLNQ